MKEMDWMIPEICAMGLHFRLDGFRLVYLCIAVLMWTVSGVFSLEYMAHYKKKRRYYLFFWATFIATAGVFLSADFYTTFIFFEIMSFTSYVWVAFDERKESLRAAETYLAVAVIGGMVMLMGLFLLDNLFGTLAFDELGTEAGKILRGELGIRQQACALGSPRTQLYVASGLLLFGFGAKAGCFPLHIWLPKAHPVAPAPASALLSGILTKAGVFGVIVVSCVMLGTSGEWGMLVACLGLVTMFLGGLLALFSINLKRTLACSSVSQIGFILTGIGMSCLLRSAGKDIGLAVEGTFLHMVNHSLFKLVLFLCAAAVFMNLHQLDLNDIRGFGRKKPMLLFCYLMGALGISGVPLWSGYISKTLIHESIVEYAEAVNEAGPAAGQLMAGPAFWRGAEWLFLLSGGLTVAYMLKLFFVLFIDIHPTRQKEFDDMSGSYMRPLSGFVLALPSVIILALGVIASSKMDRLAYLGREFFRWEGQGSLEAYFSPGNLSGGMISLGIGMVLYSLVVRLWMMDKGSGRYVDRWPAWMDLEEVLYRPAIRLMVVISLVACRILEHMTDGLILAARKTTHRQIPSVPSTAGKGKVYGKRRRWHWMRPSWTTQFLLLSVGRLRRSGRLVEESFSYGLMLVCIGLCLTLGYLLLAFLRG